MLPLSPTSLEFGKLKTVAQALMSQKEWTPAAVVALGGSLAAEVNSLVQLSGSQKKQLVLDVIKAVLLEAVEKTTDLSGAPLASKEFVQSLLFVLESVLPASLDLAVAAARGQIDLKKVKASVFVGFLSCLPIALGFCGASRAQAQMAVAAVKEIAPVLTEEDTVSDKPTPAGESDQKEVSQIETAQLKNSPSAALAIRVPEASAESNPQKA